MSGIAGIIHFDGRPVEPGQVEAMTAAMHYRGPDGIYHWRSGNVALGQCMLRTTPESLEETQPLTNEDGSLVLVMDGRVDNWEDLRRELLGKGAALRTRADAELVLRAYEAWGRDCLNHIEGDFALVIWDVRRREAFCARDVVGNKPFNYHWNGATFVFSSELHPILALPWVPEVLNQDMLSEYLATDWLSLDETLWQGVLRLKPAEFIVVNGEARLPSQRFWIPDFHLTLPCRTDEDYIEHYLALFTDVVRRMSRACHPVACEVSGGLDSSAIFAVAESLRQQGGLPAPGLEGYTLDFGGDPAADELAYVRAVGSYTNRCIYEVAPSHQPLESYRDLARQYREFPDYPNGAMGLSIAQFARTRGSRVLISGTGGDEWLGGSSLYYAEAISKWRWEEIRASWHRDRGEVGFQVAIWRQVRLGLVPLLPDSLRRNLRKIAQRPTPAARPHWLTPVMQQRFAQRTKSLKLDPTLEFGRVGQRHQLQHLRPAYWTMAKEMNERRASRAGLEWRQPFWNARIIQAALATPEHLRRRGLENKWLHRRAMAGLLPEAVVNRQTKAEFSVAFTRYWDDLVPALIGRVLPSRRSWVDPEILQDLLCKAIDPNKIFWRASIAWTLFCLDAVADQDA